MKRVLLSIYVATAFAGILAGEEAVPFDLPYYLDVYLFPEYQYLTNPAILSDLEQELLVPMISTSITRSANSDTHTVDTIGAVGGSDVTSSWYWDAYAGAELLRPLDAGKALMVSGYARPQFSGMENKTVNYTTTPEDVRISSHDAAYTVSATAAYGMSKEAYDLGFGGGYYFYHDPVREELDRRTDAAQNNGERYIDDPSTPSSQITNATTARVGLRKRSAVGEVGIAATGSLTFIDTGEEYIAVDTNGDGYDDTVVQYDRYYIDTTWGLGNPFYDAKSLSVSALVRAYPYLVRALSGRRNLLVSGYYDVLRVDRSRWYVHTNAGALSETIAMRNRSLTSGSVFVGLDTDSAFGTLRYGARVSVDANRISAKGFDNAGVSTFDSSNTHHLTEVNWTAEPDNQDVIAAGDPSLTLSTDLHALAGLFWTVNETVTITGYADLSYEVDLTRYQVFDTGTTASVWTEWTTLHTVRLQAALDASLRFALTDASFVTVRGSIPINISPTTVAQWSLDDLPAGASGDSTAITSDTSTSSSTNFGLSVSYTVRR